MALVIVVIFTIGVAVLLGEGSGQDLMVGSFNIRIFGGTKLAKDAVNETLLKILSRYDLVLIMEIRDSSGTAIKKLISSLSDKTKKSYAIEISPRLGRTTSKEQYAFVYRTDLMSVVSSYVYNDVNDIFERDPFIVTFSSPKTAIKRFVCVGIHTKPAAASEEVSTLVDVYDHIVAKQNIDDVLIMGDYNADCDYLKSWNDITLAADPRFYWLIDNQADTTVEPTDCSYDRFVVAGKCLTSSIVRGSPGVFYFDEVYSLTKEEALLISDHYPIEFMLASAESSSVSSMETLSYSQPLPAGVDRSQLNQLASDWSKYVSTSSSVFSSLGYLFSFFSSVTTDQGSAQSAENPLKDVQVVKTSTDLTLTASVVGYRSVYQSLALLSEKCGAVLCSDAMVERAWSDLSARYRALFYALHQPFQTLQHFDLQHRNSTFQIQVKISLKTKTSTLSVTATL